MTKVNQSDVRQFKKLRDKGLSLDKIAKETEFERSSVYYHLKKIGYRFPRKKSGYIRSVKLKPVKMYADYIREQENKKPNPLKKILCETP